MPEASAGERLDRHVAAHLDAPRNQVQHWIADGLVRVAGRAAKASRPLAAGEAVECEVPAPIDDRITPEAGELAVLFADEHLLVVDKPAGLAVHPGAGRPTGTLVHRLLHRYPEVAGVGGPGRPGIVHRLDKDTSGVMVVARTAQAYRALTRSFAARDVDKAYLAVVYGLPEATGRVEAPIGRHPQHRVRMAVRPEGRPAISTWRRVATGPGVALLEVGIETGRTHQIRVHLKSVAHPLVGDPLYGAHRWKELPGRRQALLRDFPRPALHAWRLAFAHPVTGGRVAVTAPVPEDLRGLWEGVSQGPWPEPPGAPDPATGPGPGSGPGA
ncbi:MAG TPA: RluA family pseudouridine synthase [Thermoanaerobaculia bacterium]|nr:RluA family pseudouridine synthase [Thermoanaerobaculia bacterium]